MISLQTVEQIHNVFKWNDATPLGIACAGLLAFGYVIFSIHKEKKEKDMYIEKLHKEYSSIIANINEKHINDVKLFNDMLIKINNQYSDSIKGLNDSIRNLVDLTKR